MTCNSIITYDEGHFTISPSVLVVNVEELSDTKMPTIVDVEGFNSVKYRMKLTGLIYHGGNNFTSRIVDKNDNVYYNAGISTGKTCIYEGKYPDLTNPNIYILQS